MQANIATKMSVDDKNTKEDAKDVTSTIGKHFDTGLIFQTTYILLLELLNEIRISF